MPRFVALGAIVGFVVLGACSDSTVSPPSPTPTAIKKVAGDAQSGAERRPLSNALVAQVTDASGAGIAGVVVQWSVTTGGGTLSASSVTTDAQGNAGVTWTLGNVPGNQSVAVTFNGLAASPATFTAVAAAPIVLHYDGTNWSTALEDVEGAGITMTSVSATTPSGVFAAGGSCNGIGLLVLRYDGTTWTEPLSTCGAPLANYTSVWGTSSSDVFVVGNHALPPWSGSFILHYDGQQWKTSYDNSCSASCFDFVRAIGGRSSTDVFAVGDKGLVLHYDGTTWSPQTSGTTSSLNAVWVGGQGSAVFAVGVVGTILYYDGAAWHTQASGTTQPLYGVWGTSASDVFAVGAAGTVLHYDGSTWTAQTSGSTQPLYGVWGSSGSSVLAVGDASTILRYNGSVWAAQTITASVNLRGVSGSSLTNVFAVGTPR